jgi:hypothetical protein
LSGWGCFQLALHADSNWRRAKPSLTLGLASLKAEHNTATSQQNADEQQDGCGAETDGLHQRPKDRAVVKQRGRIPAKVREITLWKASSISN